MDLDVHVLNLHYTHRVEKSMTFIICNRNIFIFYFNSGIGLSLAKRILDEEDGHSQLILACRNKSKAEGAKQFLLEDHPEASVEVVLLDTSSLVSVYNAAKSIRLR